MLVNVFIAPSAMGKGTQLVTVKAQHLLLGTQRLALEHVVEEEKVVMSIENQGT